MSWLFMFLVVCAYAVALYAWERTAVTGSRLEQLQRAYLYLVFIALVWFWLLQPLEVVTHDPISVLRYDHSYELGGVR